MTSVVGHRNRLSLVSRPGKEISSADHVRRAPGEIIPGICADPTACKDPVISFLPADGGCRGCQAYSGYGCYEG